MSSGSGGEMRAVFVSHGSPTVLIDECPARDFLRGLGASLERPRAILCVSAHWETAEARVSAAAHPETIHDFHGFDEALYAYRYPAPGAPALACRVIGLLGAAGMAAAIDPERGLDHGAWVPLLLGWPAADIPVAQLSIQHHLGPGHHLRLGRALAPLAEEGVLILASGSVTHDLADIMPALRDGTLDLPPPEWARAFAQWVGATIGRGDHEALCDYRARAPHATRAHPRDEHLLPLLVAAGAGGVGERLHESFVYGSLSMAAFAF